MPHDISPFKYNSKNSSSMPHHNAHYISLLKKFKKISHATSFFSIKNNSKNSRSMSHHLIPHHISPLKNALETSIPF
jgi:hypothetical protein